MKGKIAALIVTYNRKGLLLECLDALKKQTYTELDIYVIDNASTDGTKEALRKYIENNDNELIRHIEGELFLKKNV